MVDPEPIDRVIRKIKKKWDADKENWSVISNHDKDGNKEMIITQAPNSYWLKMKTITARSTMAYGLEIKNLDDEINKKIKTNKKISGKSNVEQELKQLFGLIVPSKKNIYYTTGIEEISPQKVQHQKDKIEEKQKDADKLYRLYLRKKWEREQALRDGMYL
ncbi:MAG: hypothetical protein DRO88_13195 [Promethearchaeia archaeon]|nr:MAG: hypothetical protein DRO88_13195 [Candidatus Lokiarchaeia archaeon]